MVVSSATVTPEVEPRAPSLPDWVALAVPGPGADRELFARLKAASGLETTSPARANERTIFGGRVAVRHFRWSASFHRQFRHAPHEHPNIDKAQEWVRCWPEAWRQMGEVIDAFNPMLIEGVDNEIDHKLSNSHQPDRTVGSLWATVHNPILLAQAFVHEMAHNKLFALGQQFERSGPLFSNPQSELYDSPVRLDTPRPISAVFHGVYAFTHVLALDLKMLTKAPGNLEILGLARHNARRVARGLSLIEKCARWTRAGQAFFRAFRAWAWSQVEEGLRRTTEVARSPSGPVVLIGPAGAGKTTLARLIHERFATPVRRTDDYCWDLWWQTELVQTKALETWGSPRLLRALEERGQISRPGLIYNWMREGRFSAEEVDRLKLHAIATGVREFAGGVLDLGAGHCLLSTPQARTELARLLSAAHARVVLVRPVLDLQKTQAVLERRVQGRTPETQPDSIARSLMDPTFRELGTFVIDTDALGEQEALARLKAILDGAG